MKVLILTLICNFFVLTLKAQEEVLLYSTIPNAKSSDIREIVDSTSKRGHISKVVTPTLRVFLPEKIKSNGHAVIICPGGGYSMLVINHEGHDVAKELAKKGFTAFVLKYRLPNDQIMVDKSLGPLQDVQQAIKLVRDGAHTWNINPSKVGVMGFSAGGHLASLVSTHYAKPLVENTANTNLRPDFSVLIYPVISFDEAITHMGSKNNLIGKTANKEKIIGYSNEKQVTNETPPAFIVHCADDKVVKLENSLNYYRSLHDHGVKAEMHIYSNGGHGFGLNNPGTKDQWLTQFANWVTAL